MLLLSLEGLPQGGRALLLSAPGTGAQLLLLFSAVQVTCPCIIVVSSVDVKVTCPCIIVVSSVDVKYIQLLNDAINNYIWYIIFILMTETLS